MVNLLNLCDRLIQSWLPATEVESLVTMDYLKAFLSRNYLEMVERIDKGNQRYYKVIRKEIPVYFISGSDDLNFSFLDLSDIHFGHPDFKENLLRAKLQEALDIGVKHVFIAGDIFEGIQKYVPYEEALAIQYKQLEMAYRVFREYDLNYYAINGNHDYTFEFFELHNPIALLQNMLQREGINFKFFDVYIMDFIVSGVAKRLMHIEKYKKPVYGLCVMERIKRFSDEELIVPYEGQNYPIRFFTCGHIHINMELYYAKKKIYISQPGSFVQGNSKCDRGIFVHGEIDGEKVLRC